MAPSTHESERRLRATHGRTLLVALLALGMLQPTSSAAQDNRDGLMPLSGETAAVRHFRIGLHDSQNIFPAGAARHFEMAVDADPDFGLARFMHVLVDPTLGGAARRAALANAYGQMSGASPDEMLLASALMMRASGNAAASASVFSGLSEMYPEDPGLALYAAQTAGAAGDQTDVVAHWKAFTERFPDFAPAYNTLAYAQWRAGDAAGAQTSVRRYLELAPDHPNAHDSYAEMAQFQRAYPLALTHYQHAIDRNPGFNQAYVGMAEIYHAVGQLEFAVAQMELAVEHAISPNNAATTLRQLASIQAQHGDRDGAMRSLGRAATAAAEAGNANAEATAHRQMALTDALMNGGRSAQAHLDQAAQLTRSDLPVQHLTTALVHAATGDAEGAHASASAFFESTGRAPGARSMVQAITAMAMLDGGDAEGAIAELHGADLSQPVVKAVLSRAYEKGGFPVASARLKRDLVENETVVLANMFEMWSVMIAQRD